MLVPPIGALYKYDRVDIESRIMREASAMRSSSKKVCFSRPSELFVYDLRLSMASSIKTTPICREWALTNKTQRLSVLPVSSTYVIAHRNPTYIIPVSPAD